MEHSQDDPRRSLRPPDVGRDDLLGEVMRKKRFVPTQRVASRSGGSVLRIGIKLYRLAAKRWARERETDLKMKRQKVLRYFLGKGYSIERIELALASIQVVSTSLGDTRPRS